MNLAVHGLSGDIREGNSYYEDLHDSVGRFDFVMANPPFNVDRHRQGQARGRPALPVGLPKADNGNYLWIQLFATALERDRPGRLRDGQLGRRTPRHSEGEIRRKLIEDRLGRRDGRDRPELLLHRHAAGDAVVPRPRQARRPSAPTQVLFIDARQHLPPDRPRPPRLHRRADRVPRQHRPALPRRGARVRRRARTSCSRSASPTATYADVPGLCKVATVAEIEAQGWSLNPGRYVGTEVEELDDEVFEEKLAAAHDELRELADEADAAATLRSTRVLDGAARALTSTRHGDAAERVRSARSTLAAAIERYGTRCRRRRDSAATSR